MDRRIGLFGFFALIFFAGGMILPAGSEPAVVQPIPFNHKVHAGRDVPCAECHFRCEKNRDEDGDIDCKKCEETEFIFCEEHRKCPDHKLPGLPGVEVCISCHEGDDASDPEKAVLMKFLEKKEPIPWIRATRLPSSNVYFSHRQHAILERIRCQECHGEVASMESPPPPLDLGMDRCLSCHHAERASEGCVACHR